MENKKDINKTNTKSKQICNHKDCNKKIKLIDTTIGMCRCDQTFCMKHRLPEMHDCSFNFTIDKETFIKSNLCIRPKVEFLTTN